MQLNRIFEEVIEETQNDVTDLIKEGCSIIIEIGNLFFDKFGTISLYESDSNDFNKQKELMRQRLTDLLKDLDNFMPRIEQSISNLSWDTNDEVNKGKFIKGDEAEEFINGANLRIPLIQEGFDKLEARSINLKNSINNLIKQLNKLNKVLPKPPKKILHPIQLLVNHFTRKK